MRAALGGWNIVDIGKDVVCIAVVVLERNLDQDPVRRAGEMDRRLIKRGLVSVEVAHKVAQAAVELVFHLFLVACAFVGKRHLCAAVEIGKLADALGDDVIAHLDGLKHSGIGHEVYARALPAGAANLLQRGCRLAGDNLARCVFFAGEAHFIEPAVGCHLDLDPLGERVDDRSANAVESTGVAIGIVAKFTARVELGKHDFHAGNAHLLVNLHGDTAPVIHDCDGVILVERDADLVCIAVCRLVDGVVDDFPKEVMQAALPRRADVHARAHAHRVQPLHNFDFVYCVIRCHALLLIVR
ncbi:hypothetical protein SDC9_121518 [bioreactor metagenome]|uniref:Uncharacterized protein n=1 Tax=bioreactor metagenome TaxID=1076179 RepID=A0A645CC71_9ZZZZ